MLVHVLPSMSFSRNRSRIIRFQLPSIGVRYFSFPQSVLESGFLNATTKRPQTTGPLHATTRLFHTATQPPHTTSAPGARGRPSPPRAPPAVKAPRACSHTAAPPSAHLCCVAEISLKLGSRLPSSSSSSLTLSTSLPTMKHAASTALTPTPVSALLLAFMASEKPCTAASSPSLPGRSPPSASTRSSRNSFPSSITPNPTTPGRFSGRHILPAASYFAWVSMAPNSDAASHMASTASASSSGSFATTKWSRAIRRAILEASEPRLPSALTLAQSTTSGFCSTVQPGAPGGSISRLSSFSHSSHILSSHGSPPPPA
mmetsp:Transcript_57231/g.138280  ORF Transcript_57231/g.138280 Transcript_57231/m.138280 type:complete len:316 (+) Transcript_57231:154-1101(+)